MKEFTLAGIMGACDEWAELRVAWCGELAKRRVPYFHGREIYSRSKKSPFRSWTDGQSDEFLMSMVKIIKDKFEKRPHAIVGGSTPLLEQEKRSLVETYYELYRSGVHAALRWLPKGERINFVFGTHEEVNIKNFRNFHRAVAEAHYKWKREDRIGTISHASAKTLVPLQAADLVAWVIRRNLERPEKPTPAFKVIKSMSPVIYR